MLLCLLSRGNDTFTDRLNTILGFGSQMNYTVKESDMRGEGACMYACVCVVDRRRRMWFSELLAVNVR